MTVVYPQIEALVDKCKDQPNFLEVLFGDALSDIQRHKRDVILFGAGALGREMFYNLARLGLLPVAFCDNNASLIGQSITVRDSIPAIEVIDFSTLTSRYSNARIVLTSTRGVDDIREQLITAGFSEQNIFRKDTSTTSKLLAMYSMVGNQGPYNEALDKCGGVSIMATLKRLRHKLDKVYDCLEDQHSKELFIFKLAVLASDLHFDLFKKFMLLYSEPCHEFGLLSYEGTSEDYYYFNNDVIKIDEDEIYLDVGAFDGDTVLSFIAACQKQKRAFKKIIAVEPDPSCFKQLKNNIKDIENIEVHQLGLWSEENTLSFVSSENAIHVQAGKITHDKTDVINIRVLPLDSLLNGQGVTFIKMDPSGDIVSHILDGAENTIKTYKPKLALGIYHSLEEFINVPLQIKSWCSDYRLYLRHNTYHLCDTDLYAVTELD